MLFIGGPNGSVEERPPHPLPQEGASPYASTRWQTPAKKAASAGFFLREEPWSVCVCNYSPPTAGQTGPFTVKRRAVNGVFLFFFPFLLLLLLLWHSLTALHLEAPSEQTQVALVIGRRLM